MYVFVCDRTKTKMNARLQFYENICLQIDFEILEHFFFLAYLIKINS